MGDPPLDPFSGATGLSGPLEVQLEGPGPEGSSTTEIRRPYLVVGRDRSADIVIDRAEVSRRHAYFQVVDGRLFGVDLGSRTGVRWEDGARPAGWVVPDRGVQIGPFRIRFRAETGASTGPERRGGGLPISRSFRWGSPPEALLEFPGTDPDRAPLRISRSIVLIGRSPICRVRLPGPGVGRTHAAIVRTPEGDWVVNLLGPGGLLVEGTPTRSARLVDGDRIEIGGHRLRYRLGSARTDLAGRTSRVEVMTQARLDLSGIADPVASGLLDELDRMHRRTTGQFQEALLLMFRMHQDQMDAIREGLGRINRLEYEHETLKAALAGVEIPPSPRATLRLVSGESPVPGPGLGDSLEDLGGGNQPTGARQSAGSPGVRPTRSDPEPSTPDPRNRAGRESLTGPDQHARLAQRLAEIKGEREGLWRKLLATLAGGRPDEGSR